MSTNNAEKSTLLPQEMPDIKSSGKETPVAKNSDSHTTVSDVEITVPVLKRKRTDSAGPSTTKERTRKRQRGEKVGCLRVGTYSAVFEQKDLDESFTLKLLVNSNTELDPEDEGIWKVEDAKMLTAYLNTHRFTEATLHTAWLFLRNGKEPSMATYSINQKWDVGERFKRVAKLFPDRGQLYAAATLFDLGLAMRCPKLQRAAYGWYSEVRSGLWSPKCFANPSFCKWVAEKLPEEKYRVTQYSAWLEVLKEHDPEMMRSREAMIEDTKGGSSGLAADLPELEVLEPAWLYDYHLGTGTSRDAAGVDITATPGEEETHVPDAEDEQSDEEDEERETREANVVMLDQLRWKS
ncbi:unnamed protein product [Aureobasidium vineae]|uniref:Uncharacterized protein n=1 Tax=Aureobasidium vineae TaxID=2773715 RepID=A0A9N8PCP7_9PEZI|nr:unnamed protein product [Aureobasidium vineae]